MKHMTSRMARTLQFIDIAGNDSRRSTLHAIFLEFISCHLQKRAASDLSLFQDPQVFRVQIIGKFGLKVLDEPFRAPSSDVVNGRRLGGDDRASGYLQYEEPDKVMNKWYLKWNEIQTP